MSNSCIFADKQETRRRRPSCRSRFRQHQHTTHQNNPPEAVKNMAVYQLVTILAAASLAKVQEHRSSLYGVCTPVCCECSGDHVELLLFTAWYVILYSNNGTPILFRVKALRNSRPRSPGPRSATKLRSATFRRSFKAWRTRSIC